MTHRAWLVDLDGTLYRALPVKLAMAAELALGGWSAAGRLRVFRREHERLRHELEEEVTSPWSLQLERAAARLGVEPPQLERLVVEWMVERPGKWIRRFLRRSLLEEIAEFRRRGGRTALVSDYPARRKLDACGVAELFEQVVANGEQGGPGRLKPWPDGYLLAAEQLGMAPGDCLVIGDRADADGEAARRAGMAFRRIA